MKKIKITKSALRALADHGAALDITAAEPEKLPRLECIGTARDAEGRTAGALLIDDAHALYVITSRSSNLYYCNI